MTNIYEKRLVTSLHTVFPKLQTYGLYAIECDNDWNLNFRLGDPYMPRLTYSKYSESKRLLPYYCPTEPKTVTLADTRAMGHRFLDFVGEGISPYEVVTRISFDECSILYEHPRFHTRYFLRMWHPRGWCIEVDDDKDWDRELNIVYSENH